MAIWSILRPFVYFMVFGIFFRFGMLHQEKSGNPDCYFVHFVKISDVAQIFGLLFPTEIHS
jgi:hypothetical protein